MFLCYSQVSVESISGSTPPKMINVKIRVGKEDSHSGSASGNIFEDPIYISIPEDTPVGSYIHDIEPVRDNISKAKNTMFNFELFDQIPINAFELAKNPKTSKSSIKLIRLLDYEKDQRYVMTVRVTADENIQAGVTFSTLLTVVVQVQDVNDITPEILSSNAIKINSDVKLNVPITKVIAADEDRGEAGRISYSIIGGNADEIFHVSRVIYYVHWTCIRLVKFYISPIGPSFIF